MCPAFHDHFSRVARQYADFRPPYPAALLDYLATVAPRAGTVWDCACGSGQASVGLADRFEKVVATDASDRQIASAAAHPRIEYRVAPAHQSGLPAGSVGLVTVAQAVHWFDVDRFYQEVMRVLMPDGVIALWAYGVCQVSGKEIDRVARAFYAETVGPYWPRERSLVENGYRTIPFPFEELTPPDFCMEAVWNLEQLLGYFSTWSATTRYIEAEGHSPIEPLRVELGRLWGPALSRRTVVWPLALRVGRRISGC